MAPRPLSPHLSVYRFAYTMALSILHRITGVALASGLLVLVAWLLALGGGPQAYAAFTGFMGHGLIQVVLGAWLLAFLYHLANGIRHLFWDTGRGFAKTAARRSARMVIAFVVVAGALLVYVFFWPAGGVQ